MKKRLLLILLGAALVAGSVIGAIQFSHRDAAFNANLEALSRSELPFGGMCSKTGHSGVYRMQLCSKCDGIIGFYAMDTVAFCNKGRYN